MGRGGGDGPPLLRGGGEGDWVDVVAAGINWRGGDTEGLGEVFHPAFEIPAESEVFLFKYAGFAPPNVFDCSA